MIWLLQVVLLNRFIGRLWFFRQFVCFLMNNIGSGRWLLMLQVRLFFFKLMILLSMVMCLFNLVLIRLWLMCVSILDGLNFGSVLLCFDLQSRCVVMNFSSIVMKVEEVLWLEMLVRQNVMCCLLIWKQLMKLLERYSDGMIWWENFSFSMFYGVIGSMFICIWWLVFWFF